AIEYVMAATFTWGLLSAQGSWYLGHTWSLSIEEQFYLAWPFVFVFFANRRLQILVIAFCIGLPMMTVLTQQFLPARSAWLLPANGFYLAAGCLLAILRRKGEVSSAAFQGLRKRLLLPLSVFLAFSPVLFIKLCPVLTPLAAIPGALGIALLVHQCIEDKKLLKRFLESPPMVMAGRISYSLYLWQQLFMGRFGTQWWQSFPQNLLFLAATAGLSHWLLEKPFFGLRYKLRPPALQS
ncbi:MAG: acyltransferase 3, partial [Verrucomicrobiaceae bacterium]|nr:acyltransferase 3 [Verrucomicrobiaceae bacterium]